VIVKDSNFFYRSDSLADVRNRYFILIGNGTRKANGIEIRNTRIIMPNPHYTPPPEEKYYKFKRLKYPDLSNQANLDFCILTVEDED